MEITYLNTSELRVLHICLAGRSGGAYTSAFRIHSEHDQLQNVKSFFLDSKCNSIEPKYKRYFLSSVLIIFNIVNSLILKLVRNKSIPFSLRVLRINLINFINFAEYDYVYIHWLGRSVCMDTDDVNILEKMILVHRDYQFVTAGCHYPISCNMLPVCQNCPAVKKRGKKLLHSPVANVDMVKANFFISRHMLDKVNWLSRSRYISNVCEIDFADQKNRMQESDKSEFKIGFVATNVFSFEKGFDILISALGKSGLKDRNITVFAYGEFCLREAEYYKKEYHRLHFCGKLDFSALSDAYSECDLVVVPSRNEAFGKVAVEAQMSGTPVVVSSRTGLTDTLIDKCTGRIFENGCSESLSLEIGAALDDLDSMILNIFNNREFYHRFSPEAVAKDMLRV